MLGFGVVNIEHFCHWNFHKIKIKIFIVGKQGHVFVLLGNFQWVRFSRGNFVTFRHKLREIKFWMIFFH